MPNKAKVEIVNNDEIKIITPQYDPNSGAEIEPRVDGFIRSTVEVNLEAAKAEVKRLEGILAQFPQE